MEKYYKNTSIPDYGYVTGAKLFKNLGDMYYIYSFEIGQISRYMDTMLHKTNFQSIGMRKSGVSDNVYGRFNVHPFVNHNFTEILIFCYPACPDVDDVIIYAQKTDKNFFPEMFEDILNTIKQL